MPKKSIKKIVLRCPTCSKIVTAADPELPFCSDRCRVIDLGKWASGAYVISSPVHDLGEDEAQARPSSDEEYD